MGKYLYIFISLMWGWYYLSLGGGEGGLGIFIGPIVILIGLLLLKKSKRISKGLIVMGILYFACGGYDLSIRSTRKEPGASA